MLAHLAAKATPLLMARVSARVQDRQLIQLQEFVNVVPQDAPLVYFQATAPLALPAEILMLCSPMVSATARLVSL